MPGIRYCILSDGKHNLDICFVSIVLCLLVLHYLLYSVDVAVCVALELFSSGIALRYYTRKDVRKFIAAHELGGWA